MEHNAQTEMPLQAKSSFSEMSSEMGWMPHGSCYLWDPSLLATHAISDALIGTAYLGISIILYFLVKKIRLRFSRVVVFFGVFIGACGLTHYMEIWTLWHANYWLSGGIKVITAIASVGTAVYLYRLRHPLVQVAEAAKLAEQRRLDLEALTQSLEKRVSERTAELERRTAELETLLANTPIGLAFVDRNYKYLRVNKTLSDANKTPVGDHIGKTIQDVIPKDASKVIPIVDQVFQTGRTIQTEIIGNDSGSEGDETYWLTGFYPVFSPSHQVEVVGTYALEVTDQRKAEKKLRRLASTLLAVLNTTQESVWLFDLEGRVELANQTALRRLNLPLEETVGRNFHEVFPPSVSKSRWTQFQKVIETGQEVQFEDVRDDIDFIHHYSPLFNDKGEVQGVVAFSRDITERKKWEKAIAESEGRFRAVSNFIPQLAWMTDATGYITWYNQRWYDYTGTTLEEMRGWGWERVHHPDHTQRVTEKWLHHLKTGEFWEDTFPLRSVHGEYRWFLSRAFPLRNESGQIMNWFGTNTDITAQREIEAELKRSRDAAEKANAAKTQFLANMSHEIRTPIGAIVGFTELLRTSDLSDSERLEFVSIIDRNSKQLLRLIDDILDLSKVEVGKLKVEKIKIALPEFIDHLETAMALKAREKGIGFSIQTDEPIPDQAETDPTRLKQILDNIIGNAIKFTDKGTVNVKVQFQQPNLSFTVRDTGEGIPDQQKERLFRPFEQADPSMTRKFGGTGLGLVLSKRLAQALGGDTVLEWSQPGQGSQFRVSVRVDSLSH